MTSFFALFEIARPPGRIEMMQGVSRFAYGSPLTSARRCV
jgi:hypothetical protein